MDVLASRIRIGILVACLAALSTLAYGPASAASSEETAKAETPQSETKKEDPDAKAAAVESPSTPAKPADSASKKSAKQAPSKPATPPQSPAKDEKAGETKKPKAQVNTLEDIYADPDAEAEDAGKHRGDGA